MPRYSLVPPRPDYPAASVAHLSSAALMPHYVDEFVFRFNRRRAPMAAFRSLLGLSTQHAPTTHKMLYAAEPTG